MLGIMPDGTFGGRAAKPRQCNAWLGSVQGKGKIIKMAPGKACKSNCKFFPCVAIVVKSEEEATLRQQFNDVHGATGSAGVDIATAALATAMVAANRWQSGSPPGTEERPRRA